MIFFLMTFHSVYSQDEILSRSRKENKTIDANIKEIIKNEDTPHILNFSGREIKWQGKLLKKNINDAYFEYFLKNQNGDTFRALSAFSLNYKTNDYISIKGIIFIKDGKFSHIVIKDANLCLEPVNNSVSANKGPSAYSFSLTQKQYLIKISSWIRYYNPGISKKNSIYFSKLIIYYSLKYKQDPFLITALISAESAFNSQIISSAGAIGLGQLMPATASMLGVNPFDPEDNIKGTVIYLSCQMQKWKKTNKQLLLALASYNAGPQAVEKYNSIPPYQETIDYVVYVTNQYNKLKKL